MQWKTVTEYVVGQSPKDLPDDSACSEFVANESSD